MNKRVRQTRDKRIIQRSLQLHRSPRRVKSRYSFLPHLPAATAITASNAPQPFETNLQSSPEEHLYYRMNVIVTGLSPVIVIGLGKPALIGAIKIVIGGALPSLAGVSEICAKNILKVSLCFPCMLAWICTWNWTQLAIEKFMIAFPLLFKLQ